MHNYIINGTQLSNKTENIPSVLMRAMARGLSLDSLKEKKTNNNWNVQSSFPLHIPSR